MTKMSEDEKRRRWIQMNRPLEKMPDLQVWHGTSAEFTEQGRFVVLDKYDALHIFHTDDDRWIIKETRRGGHPGRLPPLVLLTYAEEVLQPCAHPQASPD